MRLTLRTLLAYLDSNLPSDQSVELESKIKQSEAAQQLIARIREVQGRVRLGAPSVHGRGTGGDPNSVAEYLDNRLRSEKTTEIEKICIESDMQLAEVAACHQILSQVLGKPLQSPHELRQRLYGIQDLVINEGQPHADADFVRPASATNGAVAAAPDANASHGAWYYVLVGALSLSITLVLLAGGTYLLGGFGTGNSQEIADQNGERNGDSTDEGAGEETVIVPVDKLPPVGDGDAPEEGTVPPPEAPGEGLAGAAGSATTGTDSETPKIVVDNGVPPAPTTTPEATPTEDSDAPPAPASTPAEAPAPPTLEVAAPGPIGVVAEFADAANLVALFDPQNIDASRVPIDGKIVAGEEYVTFPLFESAVYASPFRFRFLGDSHWGFTAASGDVPMTLALDQGTVRIVADQPASLIVRLNGHAETIRFEEAGAELAVRVSISRYPGDDPRSVVSPHVGDYYLIKGKATLGSETPPLPLEPGKAMRWTEGSGIVPVETPTSEAPPAPTPSAAPPAPVAAEGENPAGAPPAPPAMPDWVEPTKDALEEKAAVEILASLPADRPLKLSLTEMAIADGREEVQAVAARALCSLQYFDAALESFRDPEQRSYWQKTLRAIRRNLPLSPESAAALRTGVENKYPVDAEVVWSMLLGYSPDQLSGKGAADLVGDLEHPDQAVRVLAWLNLWEVTGITHLYRPEVVENRRRSAVNRWQAMLRDGEIRYLHPPLAAQVPQELEEAAPPPPTTGGVAEEPAAGGAAPKPPVDDEPTIVEESDAPPPPGPPSGDETSTEEGADAAPPAPLVIP